MAASEADHFLAYEDRLRRWAAELRDETLQTLGAVRMRLAAARRGEPQELEDAAAEAVDQLTGQIWTLRSLISELRPATLDEFGLEPALGELATGQAAAAGFEVDVAIDPAALPLAPQTEILLFRVAQEALFNASAHAGAEHVGVSLRPAVGGVVLEINDDGSGFDTSRRGPLGLGLGALRERLAGLGGTLRVRSVLGEGTTVRARVPQVAPARAR